MKIISKTKDYYDFCVGKYGVDPKLVYDRRDGKPFIFNMQRQASLKVWNYPKDYLGYLIVVHIGNRQYPMVLGESGKFLGSIEDFDNLYSKLGINRKFKYGLFLKNAPESFYKETFGKRSDQNKLFREPILIEDKGSYFTASYPKKSGNIFKPINLSDYNFAHVMSPEMAWIEISSFLGWCVDNPPLPDTQTNKEKIVSHGFDLKQSFRN